MPRIVFALFAAALAAASAARAQAPVSSPVQIRFCPEAVARPYPLDSLRGVQGLLLQNVALINQGQAPVTIGRVEIELRNGQEIVDRRTLTGKALDTAIASARGAEAQGLFTLLGFQFCDGKLLAGAKLAASNTLASGQALLIMQQVFAYRGPRTEARVVAYGDEAGNAALASAGIRLDGAPSVTKFRWPMPAGRTWLVAAAASFHTTHRWALPEEFALDIIAADGDGATHKGKGGDNRNFYAYGADVLAAADGRIVKLVSGAKEEPPLLRRPGEAMADYYSRIGARQAANIALGEPGVIGDAVIIDHGNSEYSVYAHLQPGSVRVKMGDMVRAGQPVGRLGSSGNSTEPHLHFQVCDQPSGTSCAGIAPNFVGINLPLADGDRPLQSGDLVRAVQD